MQALIELLAGFLALLAAAALHQIGVDFKTAPKAEREVHRVVDCPPQPSQTFAATDREDAPRC
jgi:hypothetical protein